MNDEGVSSCASGEVVHKGHSSPGFRSHPEAAEASRFRAIASEFGVVKD